jgi:pseudouridine kinase
MGMGIVVLGAVFVDIKGYPSEVYIPGGRNAGRVEQVHGGVSRNIAEDIANVELRPTFISLVDDSGAGADVIKKLKSHKVNTDYIRVTPNGMGTWLAVFGNNGDVEAAISKRPDLHPILDTLIEHGDEIFSQADSISLEIDIDKDIVKQVFMLAEKYGKPVYAVVSNMRIAVERRDFLRSTHCFVCNQQEAGILFSDDYSDKAPEEMADILAERIKAARIQRMIVTMGEHGAVYATIDGEKGICPAKKVDVKDTTGAGDAFFAGATIGLTYGKTMQEACEIGTRLAASVICTSENVCPRFLPEEFGLDISIEE